MSTNDYPLAEMVERQYRMLAFIIFLLALIHALIASRALVDSTHAETILKYAQLGLVSIMLPSIAVLVYWKIRLVRNVPNRKYLAEPEGFAWEVWRKAMVHSWVATLLVLTVARKMEETIGNNVDLLASGSLALMLGVFSGSFFLHYRSGADEGLDGEDPS